MPSMAPSLRHILAVFFRGIRHSLPSRGFWHTRRRRGLDAGLPVPLGIPLEDLDNEVQKLAEKLTNILSSQLMCMKLIVNQAYENMGLQSTQTLGPILDGIMRNTPEGRGFVNDARDLGVKAVVTKRDAPFGDYSQGPKAEQPRKRSEL